MDEALVVRRYPLPMPFTTAQYDSLERATADGRRVAVRRRGKGEVVVLPRALRLVGGREGEGWVDEGDKEHGVYLRGF